MARLLSHINNVGLAKRNEIGNALGIGELRIFSDRPCLTLQRFHLANLCSDFPGAHRQCHLDSGNVSIGSSKIFEATSLNECPWKRVDTLDT